LDSQDWKRIAIAGAVVVITLVVAKLIDRAISRRLRLTPEALTRYRVLRRSIMVVIVLLGTLSALLVIPEVRAVAGGVLASSAVVALVAGMAARSSLANFVAGMLIAVAQPFRLGDEIEIDGASGTVEEISLTYTTIREPGGARFYVPNEKLASDTIRNATIAGAEHLAQVRVPVPLDSDLDRVVTLVEEEARAVSDSPEARPIATVTDFDPQANKALIMVEARTPQGRAEATAAEIRRAVHRRLRAEGLI
jgi:small-conductance mechanosensitive channel